MRVAEIVGAARGRHWPGLRVVLPRQYVGEGRGEVDAVDLVVAVDVDLLEESLIEVSALLGRGLQVRQAAVGSDLDGELDDSLAVCLFGFRRGNRCAGVVELVLEPLLLASQEIERYGTRVVGLQQGKALVLEVTETTAGSTCLTLQRRPLLRQLRNEAFLDSRRFLRVQLDAHVVADDRVFDALDGDVGLRASVPALASGAEEVRVLASGLVASKREDEPGTAAAAEEAAFEVVMVLAVAFAGERVRLRHASDAVEQVLVDERLVTAASLDAFKADIAQVVPVVEDAAEGRLADRRSGPGSSDTSGLAVLAGLLVDRGCGHGLELGGREVAQRRVSAGRVVEGFDELEDL